MTNSNDNEEMISALAIAIRALQDVIKYNATYADQKFAQNILPSIKETLVNFEKKTHQK